MSNIARNRIKSSWTPLNNEEANQKVLTSSELVKMKGGIEHVEDNRSPDKLWRQKIFEERRGLVTKWFEKWSDEQRRVILTELLNQCKTKQLEFAGDIISRKRPIYRDDFSRCLPRVLSLYIFSFLDPRSLCRSAQVCWYWKHLVEVDQIWMPKCVRLGWLLSFTPSPYEVGMWKKLYIENIKTLKCMVPKQPQGVSLQDIEKLRIDSNTPRRPQSGRSMKLTGSAGERPPWRGSDPAPKDTWRNNYLENDDEVSKVQKLRKKHIYGPLADEIVKKAKNKVQTGQNRTSLTRELLAKSRSMPMGFDTWPGMPSQRPDWATMPAQAAPFVPVDDPTAYTDASRRPAPVFKPNGTTRKMSPTRTNRDPPSTELFPSKGWTVPNDRDPNDSDN